MAIFVHVHYSDNESNRIIYAAYVNPSLLLRAYSFKRKKGQNQELGRQ